MSSDAKDPETLISRVLRELTALVTLWHERKGVFVLFVVIAVVAGGAGAYSIFFKPPAAITVSTALPTSPSNPSSTPAAIAAAPSASPPLQAQVSGTTASQASNDICSPNMAGVIVSGGIEIRCQKPVEK